METKQEIKTAQVEMKPKQTEAEKCNSFLKLLEANAKVSLQKAQDRSISDIALEYEPSILGFAEGVTKIRITYSRDFITAFICKLLGVSPKSFNEVVIKGVEKAKLYTDYNTAVKALLKEHKPSPKAE